MRQRVGTVDCRQQRALRVFFSCLALLTVESAAKNGQNSLGKNLGNEGITFEYLEKSPKKIKQKNSVCLCWMGYCTPCTRQRYPTTARRGHFELLGVPPGPNRTSLDNLATPGSPRVSMLTSGLVRTPVQRDTKHSRTPALKPSSNSSLPVAWITGPATDPS